VNTIQRVFNIYECVFFSAYSWIKTYAFKHESCHRGKKNEDRITVLVCANMAESEKMSLLVIGKTEEGRCFKH
jgi:hypothetical protein